MRRPDAVQQTYFTSPFLNESFPYSSSNISKVMKSIWAQSERRTIRKQSWTSFVSPSIDFMKCLGDSSFVQNCRLDGIQVVPRAANISNENRLDGLYTIDMLKRDNLWGWTVHGGRQNLMLNLSKCDPALQWQISEESSQCWYISETFWIYRTVSEIGRGMPVEIGSGADSVVLNCW